MFIRLMILCLCMSSLFAAEVNPFAEAFALGDRSKALEQLIPGTNDYYFYHALDAQHRGDSKRFDTLMADWTKQMRSSSIRDRLHLRQAILDYDQKPEQSVAYLVDKLNLRFHHQPPRSGQHIHIPSSLNQQDISYQKFLAEVRRYNKDETNGFETAHLCMIDASTFSVQRLREYLRRLPYPVAPNLVSNVLRELKDKRSGGFGSLPIHNKLLLEQLQSLVHRKPDLSGHSKFINQMLLRLQPRDGSDWRINPRTYELYIERLWAYVSTLPASQNSLKAHVLYHALIHDRSEGTFNLELFKQFIALPRHAVYMNKNYVKRFRRDHANMRSNFASQTHLGPIESDVDLTRSYLEHFFANGNNPSMFYQWLDKQYVDNVNAEVQVLLGKGDQEQWASQLGAERYRGIQERVELAFTAQNKVRFQPGGKVELHLQLKNIPSLLVRVYPINTAAWYRDQKREVPTNFNVDGLVTEFEQKLSFTQHPARRHFTKIDLPMIKDRGVYLVECLGNGFRCRSVMRIGSMHVRERIGTAGHVLRVYDEQNKLIKDSVVEMGSQQFKADKNGGILVPFSTQAGQKKDVIIRHGGFAVLHTLYHQQEDYSLSTHAYIDAQDALAGQLAKLVIRPQLYLKGEPVSVADLQNIRISIVATTIEGIDAKEVLSDVKLNEVDAFVHDLRFPDRVNRVQVMVHAEIEKISTGEMQQLESSSDLAFNGMLRQQQFKDIYLQKNNQGFRINVLGRNGEAYPDHEVINIAFKHRDFTKTIHKQLRTNADGYVELGALKDIQHISVRGTSMFRIWDLDDARVLAADEYHLTSNDTLQLPCTFGRADLKQARLFSKRSGTWYSEMSSHLSIDEQGRLKMAALPAGDYELYLPYRSRALHIIVEDAERKDGQLFGKARIMEDTVPHGLHVGEIRFDPSHIQVPVQGHSDATRVHVVISRYMPQANFLEALGSVTLRSQSVIEPAALTNEYLSMRRLSDEHRYVLDRSYQDVFPSLSLQRPALILNPWERRSTQTGSLDGSDGEEFGEYGSRRGGGRKRAVGRNGGSLVTESRSPLYDFQQDGSVVLQNLGIENGVVKIPRELLSDQQYIQVIAVEPEQAYWRSAALPQTAILTRDRRFAPSGQGSDTRQDKQTIVLKKGDTHLVNLDPNAWRLLGSIEQAFDLLDTLCNDQRLKEFQFIKQWVSYDKETKDKHYSKHACHELHLFLYFKDRAFFDAVVKPTLAHKHDKTFIDQYLLEEDLRNYVRPWAFNRLNTFEQSLLLQRLQDQSDSILRSLDERVALLPSNPQEIDRLFMTALRGKSLGAKAFMAIGSGGGASSKLLKDNKKEMSQRRFNKGREEAMVTSESADDAAFMAVESDEAIEELEKAAMPAEPAAPSKKRYFARDRQEAKNQVQRLYRQVDQTKEWAENNYFQRYPSEQLHNLVKVNAFWLDWAKHKGTSFLSQHLSLAHGNASEVLIALAISDLPFEEAKHKIEAKDQHVQITADSRGLLYNIDVVAAPFKQEDAELVLTQQIYRMADRYRHEDGQRIERYVKGDILFRDVYGLQIVVTNPSARPQNVDLLKQIPAGAIALSGHFASESKSIRVGAYSVQRFDVLFYFPEIGAFTLPAASVSARGGIIGKGSNRSLTVVNALPDMDKQSWAYIADFGTNQQVLTYLGSNNIHRLDLERIAFRMQDRDMFIKTTAALDQAKRYVPVLWSYGFKHKSLPHMKTWLEHNNSAVDACGPYVQSTLLSFDPIERHQYEHLEYYPLINARSHDLSGKQQIANAALAKQYSAFLRTLHYVPRLRQRDHFVACIYLLSQDRIAEAIAHFDALNPDSLHQAMQYDYAKAYIALLREDVATARFITERYLEHGVKHWRLRFVAMHKQIIELDEDKQQQQDDPNREQDMDQRADKDAMLALETEGGAVKIQHRNLGQCTIKLFRMDLELLFSRNPFMKGDAGQFAYIAPNHQDVVSFAQGQVETTYALPEAFQKGNVLVEIEAAGLRRRAVLFVHQLHVLTQDNYAQLQVRHKESGERVTKAYVKVYARMKNGTVKFYKDGYTDFRGRFDYGALSTNDLDNVDSFALYVSHPNHGALVREVGPPQR